jgi:lysophospholipase L1-like esterase
MSHPRSDPIRAEARVIACLGASVTDARGSHNWWRELSGRERNAGLSFRAFVAGGDLSANGLERLPQIIACQPTAVVVLLGNNDLLAIEVPQMRAFASRAKHVTRDPSPEWFAENIHTIVDELTAKTSAIVGLSLPLFVGEGPLATTGLQGALNQRMDQFSTILRRAAADAAPRVTYIPVYERFRERLLTARVNPSRRGAGGPSTGRRRSCFCCTERWTTWPVETGGPFTPMGST